MTLYLLHVLFRASTVSKFIHSSTQVQHSTKKVINSHAQDITAFQPNMLLTRKHRLLDKNVLTSSCATIIKVKTFLVAYYFSNVLDKV